MNKGSSERWHKVGDAGGVGMWWHGGLISRRVVRWGKPYRRRGPLRDACLRLSRKHRGGGRRGGGAYLSARGAAAPAPASLTPSSLAWGGAAGPIRSGAGCGCTRRLGVSPAGRRTTARREASIPRQKKYKEREAGRRSIDNGGWMVC